MACFAVPLFGDRFPLGTNRVHFNISLYKHEIPVASSEFLDKLQASTS